jgi:hypothetical protein
MKRLMMLGFVLLLGTTLWGCDEATFLAAAPDDAVKAYLMAKGGGDMDSIHLAVQDRDRDRLTDGTGPLCPNPNPGGPGDGSGGNTTPPGGGDQHQDRDRDQCRDGSCGG